MFLFLSLQYKPHKCHMFVWFTSSALCGWHIVLGSLGLQAKILCVILLFFFRLTHRQLENLYLLGLMAFSWEILSSPHQRSAVSEGSYSQGLRTLASHALTHICSPRQGAVIQSLLIGGLQQRNFSGPSSSDLLMTGKGKGTWKTLGLNFSTLPPSFWPPALRSIKQQRQELFVQCSLGSEMTPHFCADPLGLDHTWGKMAGGWELILSQVCFLLILLQLSG